MGGTADWADTRNKGKPWSDRETLRLRNLGQAGTPMRLIVRELGRPEGEILSKAHDEGINLSTGNYNRLAIDFDKR